MVAVHDRIHPIFAEEFLDALGPRPYLDPLNDMHLATAVDIILGGDGQIVRLGVTKSSGQKAFDIAVLDSIDRAAPFGKPPENIRSRDGNVYFTWEFHRDPIYACSTINARPHWLATVPALDGAAVDGGSDRGR
jgi:TonB family protein